MFGSNGTARERSEVIMSGLRILIVEDHPVVEEGVRHFLGSYPEFQVVGSVSDGLAGLDMLRTEPVDIVLLDLSLPKLDGIESIRLYLREKPDLGIIAFTGHKTDAFIYQALEAGARGYVLKGNPLDQLVEAIREVAEDRYWLSPDLNHSIISRFLHKPDQSGQHDALDILSTREQQVFRMLAKGNTTEEVANFLSISPKTVAKHRVAIKNKLQLRNTAEIANYAVRTGIVDLYT